MEHIFVHSFFFLNKWKIYLWYQLKIFWNLNEMFSGKQPLWHDIYSYTDKKSEWASIYSYTPNNYVTRRSSRYTSMGTSILTWNSDVFIMISLNNECCDRFTSKQANTYSIVVCAKVSSTLKLESEHTTRNIWEFFADT